MTWNDKPTSRTPHPDQPPAPELHHTPGTDAHQPGQRQQTPHQIRPPEHPIHGIGNKYFGAVAQSLVPAVKMFVRKRGSQTGPTGGQIIGIALAVWWKSGDPPDGHLYAMANQYEIFFNPAECPDGIFARGGDSGSVVLQSGTHNAVGLLWAGVSQGGRRAVMSDITLVEQRLNLTLAWAFS
ncbi:hypothetical protein ACKI1Q_38550 [Streptomyces galilaeus]|uniref:hypothetical protein n=1 Tax=Streptomyces galilaeus TaxID=33899 RepID=UPI0038F65CF8